MANGRAFTDAQMTPPDNSAPNSAVEAFGYRQQLRRSLGLFDLVVYGLIFIAPIAPFTVFGIVFNASRGMVPLVFLIGMIAMVFTAASYVTMSRIYPVAGSVYAYATRSIGPDVGFFAGWAILLDYALGPTFLYVICAIALTSSFPDVPRPIWIVAFIVLGSTINLLGIETAKRVNLALLVLQLAILTVFCVAAIAGLLHGVNGAHLSLRPFYNPAVFSPKIIFGALSMAVMGYVGFDALSTFAEEANGGPDLIGKATMLALLVVGVLFMAQSYLASLFVLGRSSFAAGDATDAAFYHVSALVGGRWLEIMVSVVGVAFSTVPAAINGHAAAARVLFGMARDGRLPRSLARVHPRRKVPHIAILLVAIVTLLGGLIFVNRLEVLTSMVSFGALTGFLLLHLSVMFHVKRARPPSEWFRFGWAPALGFLIIGYVLVNAEVAAKIAGVVWLCVGAIVLLCFRQRNYSGRGGKSDEAVGQRGAKSH